MTKVFTALVIIAFLASGCGIGTGHYRTSDSLQEKQIAQIKPGTTTKQQVLDWFGPPAAVARKSSDLKVPDKISEKAGSQAVQADTFFDLFSAKHALTEHHIIYYYSATEIKAMSTMVVAVATSDSSTLTDRLWVLIDNRTGTVVDFIYRKALPETGPRPDEKAVKEKDTLTQ